MRLLRKLGIRSGHQVKKPLKLDYLLKIIKHKVEQMEASTPEWFSVKAEDIQVEMADMVHIIDDLLSDRAERDAHVAHKQIFGPSKVEFVKVEGSEDKLVEIKVTYPEADDQETARRTLISFLEVAAITHRITMDALGRSFMVIDRWWD